MFEACMVESAGQFRSHNRKWTTAGAFLIEGALLTAGVLAALVHTDVIATTARLIPLARPYTAVPLVSHPLPAGGGGGGVDVLRQPNVIPRFIPSGGSSREHIGRAAVEGPPNLPPGIQGGDLDQRVIAAVPVAPVAPKRLVLSSMDPAKLVVMVKPAYPRTALIAKISGKVSLHAVIARNGSIQNLEVVSGNPLLVPAALDAVRQWRYKPTILGGEPVEVETTILVNFVSQ
jgi:protein TonB